MSSATDKLAQIWGTPRGLLGFLGGVNHKQVGMRFIVTALGFFTLAGIDAVLMRTQLAQPNQTIVSAQTYQELFTVHGSAMMFLFAVPILEGFAIYLLPLLIGSRDLPFPRLNAFGYWCYLFGGLTFFSSVFLQDSIPIGVRSWILETFNLAMPLVPDGGWFAYPPLTLQEYSPGSGMDFWLLGISFIEISAIIASIELIVSVLRYRAPGMSLTRMPLFAWSVLVVAFMILFAFPPLLIGSVLLEVERKAGLPFYSGAEGGDPLLWQHLFWIFGHPEVYIISLPAAGFVSMMVAPFSRRPIVGYTWVAVATVAIGFLSFGVWIHHMYTTGLPLLGMSFFAAAGLMIAAPTGIQIFAFIATIWSGRVLFSLPMLWVLAYIVLFVLGGITGVMIAVTPFDWQVHDSHFIVAHLHYVLLPGAVMPIFGAFYYWWPKMIGRMWSRLLGWGHFALFVIGFNLTFFPLHILGFLGMPRRVYSYEAGLGWEPYNLIATSGAYLMALGVLLFYINLLWSIFYGKHAGANPWNSNSLEWSVSSPPPPYNFHVIPTIQSRNPLWDERTLDESPNGVGRLLAEPRNEYRETLTTSVLDAKPREIVRLPKQAFSPLFGAIGLGFFFWGLLISFYWVAAIGLLITAASVLVWTWPGKEFFD